MRKLLWLCVLFSLPVLLPAQQPSGREVQLGQVSPSIKAVAKPDQSYALYLPSSYASGKPAPIIYLFDPGARGLMPVELMKAAAERYGYILVGSNNSRNGTWEIQSAAARAMWEDTHASLSIDSRRVYFGGFSGGARVAAQMGQGCKCARGVFQNGAGFGAAPPTASDKLAVFSLIGMGDFNYAEVVQLSGQLEEAKLPHYLLRFEGEHSWAPAETWEQALSWAAILEMKDGLRPKDDAFIAAELERAMQRIQKREAAGEHYFALQEYRGLSTAYAGLTQSAALAERIAALEQNPAIRTQMKQEQSELEQQRKATRPFFEATDRLKTRRDDERDLRSQAMATAGGLRSQLNSEKKPENRRILQRSVGSIFAAMMEGSIPLYEQREFRAAEFYLQLAAVVRPESAWTHMRLALCHAQLDDKKGARKDLAKARELGASPEEVTNFVRGNVKLNEIVDAAELEKILATTPKEAKK